MKKRRSQTPNDKDHPYSRRSKQATERPTIRLGKEDFESPSPLARRVETTGVSHLQKKVLEHDEGPTRKKKITHLFDGKSKKKKPNQKLVKAALKANSKVRRMEK